MGAIGGSDIIDQGLILHFDAANIKSFRGEPATNLLNDIDKRYGTINTSVFKSNYGTELISIPSIEGDKLVNYCNIYNDYDGGSGDCCPALFYFGTVIAIPSSVYTYQIIFKTSSGYYNENYMYRYEYNDNTYVTEGGFVKPDRMTNLGGGWIHAWGTFTTQPNTNNIRPYLFHYEYGVQNKVQVAAISLTLGDTIYDPKFLLSVNNSRGTKVDSGGGLKDLSLKGNHSEFNNGPIYNSMNNGVIIMDGIDDSFLVKQNVTTSKQCTVVLWLAYEDEMALWGMGNDGSYYFGASYYGGNYYHNNCGSPTYHIDTNQVFNPNGYLDNKFHMFEVKGVDLSTWSKLSFFDYSSWRMYGKVSIIQVYDRILTAEESLKNYKTNKNRFI